MPQIAAGNSRALSRALIRYKFIYKKVDPVPIAGSVFERQRQIGKKQDDGHYCFRILSFRKVGVSGNPLGYSFANNYVRHISGKPEEPKGGNMLKKLYDFLQVICRAAASMSRENLLRFKEVVGIKLKLWNNDFKVAAFMIWGKLLHLMDRLRIIGVKQSHELKVLASMTWVKLLHLRDELWDYLGMMSSTFLKLAREKIFSKMNRQQFIRITKNILGALPFTFFIVLIVESNMWPSTFKDKLKEQEVLLTKGLNASIGYAKKIQEEMAKEDQSLCNGEVKIPSEYLDEFKNKLRRGDPLSNEEILCFAKLFDCEHILNNMGRPLLITICKHTSITIDSSNAYLRFMIRKRLRKIKRDDSLIQAEGIGSLSEELFQACREQGLPGFHS